jgi:hypothetical protein
VAEVDNIAQSLISVLSANVADIDRWSKDSYEPAVDSQKIALIAVPFRQSDTFSWADLSGMKLLCRHTISLEFWVRLPNEAVGIARAMQRGRDIGLQAALAIASHDGEGYQLEPDDDMIEVQVDDAILNLNGPIFVRARMSVRVRQEIDLS